jgi:hypothetical protein
MESLDQFFKDNQRGYPRDPRRMAYAKLQKNIQGMDREQLEAFIKANLFIPHSQYKMALGNLINFLDKQNNMKKLDEVKQFQKIAGLINENWHPDDPADVDLDDIEDADPEDFDDVSEDANTQGRASYDLVKGPNEDPLVKRILVNLHNKYGKDGYHYDPYMNRLTIYGEAGEDRVIVDMLSALFDQPEYQDLSEDDYSENPTPNDDESQSGDTAVDNINEVRRLQEIAFKK